MIPAAQLLPRKIGKTWRKKNENSNEHRKEYGERKEGDLRFRSRKKCCKKRAEEESLFPWLNSQSGGRWRKFGNSDLHHSFGTGTENFRDGLWNMDRMQKNIKFRYTFCCANTNSSTVLGLSFARLQRKCLPQNDNHCPAFRHIIFWRLFQHFIGEQSLNFSDVTGHGKFESREGRWKKNNGGVNLELHQGLKRDNNGQNHCGRRRRWWLGNRQLCSELYEARRGKLKFPHSMVIEENFLPCYPVARSVHGGEKNAMTFELIRYTHNFVPINLGILRNQLMSDRNRGNDTICHHRR